tara:strand:+ start:487 stop:795 length:309 start_codon:yes stop_codon:yes gene_type:complete
MSHFAEIKDGVVQRVIVAEQDFINSGLVGDTFNWVQTSYNNNFRNKFAGVGDTYDKVNDVFIEPQPYPSWTLDSNYAWQPPIPRPGGNLRWNENTQTWDERA